jgi:hypothetical protein
VVIALAVVADLALSGIAAVSDCWNPIRPSFLQMAERRAVMTDEPRRLTAAKFAAMYRDKVNDCLDRMRDLQTEMERAALACELAGLEWRGDRILETAVSARGNATLKGGAPFSIALPLPRARLPANSPTISTLQM